MAFRMIVVVDALAMRPSDWSGNCLREPSADSIESTIRGRMIVPPVAMASATRAICSGVTRTCD